MIENFENHAARSQSKHLARPRGAREAYITAAIHDASQCGVGSRRGRGQGAGGGAGRPMGPGAGQAFAQTSSDNRMSIVIFRRTVPRERHRKQSPRAVGFDSQHWPRRATLIVSKSKEPAARIINPQVERRAITSATRLQFPPNCSFFRGAGCLPQLPADGPTDTLIRHKENQQE